MTLERILNWKLKTFLRESFPGLKVSNNLKPGFIKPLMVRILKQPFRLCVFSMTTDIVPENILYYCEQYYFERDWLKQSERIVDISHNGFDLSYKRGDERLFLLLAPYEDFLQVTTVRWKEKE